MGCVLDRCISSIRTEIMRRLRVCEEGKSPQPLTTREKHILITKIVADKYEEILAGGDCERAFIATGAMVAEVRVKHKAVANVTWHVGASLWDFVLENKVLSIPRTVNPAQSVVRLAYKAWKNKLTFDLGAHKIEVGILYASHVAKVCCLSWLDVCLMFLLYVR